MMKSAGEPLGDFAAATGHPNTLPEGSGAGGVRSPFGPLPNVTHPKNFIFSCHQRMNENTGFKISDFDFGFSAFRVLIWV